jgi:catechol 2,3-dioxygenase-like lactoylglutathione lyase family enzyme
MKKPINLGARVVPALLVRDLAKTLEFYTFLGFRTTSAVEPGSVWAEARRDSVVIQFHTEPPEGTPPTPIFSGTIYFYPDDVLALAEEFRDKVEFAWGPEVMEYGMREFGIRDPDGYYLAFTEPADGKSAEEDPT